MKSPPHPTLSPSGGEEKGEGVRLSLIVAASRNGVIGAGGKLPWRLPADLKRFKQLTIGRPVIMGRKTFEAIGKPLAGRTNIVVTRQKDFNAPGCQIANSLEEALSLAKTACHSRPRSGSPLSRGWAGSSGNPPSVSQEAFVIGGAEIYRQALPLAGRIELTRIEHDFPGDAHLFEIDPAVWKETARQEFPADAENPYPYRFITYERH